MLPILLFAAPWPAARACETLLAVAERHPHELEQPSRLLVVARGGGDRHLEAAQLVDLVVVDLGEDELLFETDVVVAAPVERTRREALEVARARERDVDQAIDELAHPLAAQRDHHADRHPGPDLERGDRLLGPG